MNNTVYLKKEIQLMLDKIMFVRNCGKSEAITRALIEYFDRYIKEKDDEEVTKP